MTQYLKLAVGDGAYLLASATVAEVRPGSAELRAAAAIPVIDSRRRFGAAIEGAGCDIVLDELVLVVDRCDGLAEIDDAALRRLPPIGPLGAWFDAVAPASTVEDRPPALRLCLDAVRAAAADG